MVEIIDVQVLKKQKNKNRNTASWFFFNAVWGTHSFKYLVIDNYEWHVIVAIIAAKL